MFRLLIIERGWMVKDEFNKVYKIFRNSISLQKVKMYTHERLKKQSFGKLPPVSLNFPVVLLSFEL
jgi:hypothetical protein